MASSSAMLLLLLPCCCCCPACDGCFFCSLSASTDSIRAILNGGVGSRASLENVSQSLYYVDNILGYVCTWQYAVRLQPFLSEKFALKSFETLVKGVGCMSGSNSKWLSRWLCHSHACERFCVPPRNLSHPIEMISFVCKVSFPCVLGCLKEMNMLYFLAREYIRGR